MHRGAHPTPGILPASTLRGSSPRRVRPGEAAVANDAYGRRLNGRQGCWVRAVRVGAGRVPDCQRNKRPSVSYGLRLNGLQSPFNPSGCEEEKNGFRAWSWQIGGVPICQRNKRNPYQSPSVAVARLERSIRMAINPAAPDGVGVRPQGEEQAAAVRELEERPVVSWMGRSWTAVRPRGVRRTPSARRIAAARLRAGSGGRAARRPGT